MEYGANDVKTLASGSDEYVMFIEMHYYFF